MELLERLRHAGGCARRRDVVRSHRDLAALDRLVEAGLVRRVGWGVYALPGAPEEVVAACRAGGSVTCVSALGLAGLPLLARDPRPHVVLHSHRGAPRAGLLPAGTVLHWDAAQPRRGAPLTAPLAMAIAHAAVCLPVREAVAALDAALHRGLLPDLVDVAAHRPRAQRPRFARLVRLADRRSESMPETFLRLALRQAGLAVEPQVTIDGLGRVDLLVEGLLVVEVDGHAFHADRRAFGEDRRRDRVCELLGLPRLRFTFDDAMDPRRAVHEVGLALDRHRHGPRLLRVPTDVRSMVRE